MKVSRREGLWAQKQREATESPPKPPRFLKPIKGKKSRRQLVPSVAPSRGKTVVIERIDGVLHARMERLPNLITVWKEEIRNAKKEHRAAGMVDGKPNKTLWLERWLWEHEV